MELLGVTVNVSHDLPKNTKFPLLTSLARIYCGPTGHSVSPYRSGASPALNPSARLVPHLAFALVCVGCATVSQPAVVETDHAPSISPALAQGSERTLKRKVAILRFTNETTYGRGAFGGREGSPIEKQALDLLAARLVDSGKVVLVDISGTNPQLENYSAIPADFAIIGSVAEFGRRNSSETGVFSRTKTQVAYASVNLRLVETTTGRVVYSEEGSGEAEIETGRVFGVGSDASYDSTLNDKAISAAISKLVSNMLENLLDVPWRTGILEVTGEQILISGGSEQGLRPGLVLAVLQRGRMVKNPQFNTMMELPGVEVARIEIVSFFGKGITGEGSVCKLVSGSLAGFTPESLVVEERP